MYAQNLHTVFSIQNAYWLNSMNGMAVCFSERNPCLHTLLKIEVHVQFALHSNCYADNASDDYFFIMKKAFSLVISNCSSTKQLRKYHQARSTLTCASSLVVVEHVSRVTVARERPR